MSNIDKYQKLCKKFQKQGKAPSPVDKKYLATLYICFEESNNNDLMTRSIPVYYNERYNKVMVMGEAQFGKTLDTGNNLPSSGMAPNEYEVISSLVDHNEAVEIFESIIDRSVAEIEDKSSFYCALLDNCIWEETDNNHRCTTLAVGYDPDNGKYRLYYNPSFILTGAMAQYIYCPKDYTSLEDCYNYMLKFYLIHEMSHITREHMNKNNEGLLKDCSHRAINIYGDSFINQLIPSAVLKEQKEHPPIIGVLNEISVSGVPKCNDFDYIIRDFTKMIQNLVSDEVYLYENRSYRNNGKKIIVKLVMGTLLYQYPNLNSNLFIREMNNFFSNLFRDEPDYNDGDSGNGGDGEQQDGERDSNGQGDSVPQDGGVDQDGEQDGEPGDPNSSIEDAIKQEKQNSAGAQGQKNKSEKETDQPGGGQPSDQDSGGEEGEGGEPGSSGSPGEGGGRPSAEAAEKAIRDALSKATNEENLQSKLGGDPLTGDSKPSGENKGMWRKQLAKAVSQATGIREVYDTNAPHARLQGQFGRDVEVPDFKNLLIMLDCSGSMGADVFKKVLQEIVILESMFKVKPTVHVIYWGTNPIYKRYKMNKNIFNQIKTDSKNLGSTIYGPALDMALAKCKNPDLVIDCTDAEFFEPKPTLMEIRKKRNKYNKKTIWVLTRDYDEKVMSVIDPQYKTRMIRLK